MAAFGLRREGGLPFSDHDVEIWPDNYTAVEVFARLLTQWRVAPMGGVIGLDYSVVPTVFDLLDIPRKEWRDIFDCVRIMEAEAIEVIEKRAKRAP